MIWPVMQGPPNQFGASVISTVLTVRSQVLEESPALEDLYVAHTKAAIDSLGASAMQQQKILMPKQQMTVQTMHRADGCQLRQQLILQ